MQYFFSLQSADTLLGSDVETSGGLSLGAAPPEGLGVSSPAELGLEAETLTPQEMDDLLHRHDNG